MVRLIGRLLALADHGLWRVEEAVKRAVYRYLYRQCRFCHHTRVCHINDRCHGGEVPGAGEPVCACRGFVPGEPYRSTC